MSQLEYDRLKHLELVQAVVNRMAQNSFTLKGWSVTLAAGIFALGATTGSTAVILLAVFPALAFWGLDAYYVRQERLFRGLFDAVRKGEGVAESDGPYSMSTKACKGDVDSWWRTLWSVTLLGFHGPVVLAVIVCDVVALLQG